MSTRVNRTDPDKLLRGLRNVPKALSVLGYKELRGGQDIIVKSLLAGTDTIGVLPTGAGKSACFVVPTLAHEWKTLVFSPLISLMRDQVQGLARKGIRVGQIDSTNTSNLGKQYLTEWAHGNMDLLYCAPERLYREDFVSALMKFRPDMVVIDEAHTASEWADTFRASYNRIGQFVEEAQPQVVAAFTATCPPHIEVDVRRVLCMPRAQKLVYYYRRTNLQLESRLLDHRSHLIDSVSAVARKDQSCIVYCSTVRGCEELAVQLQDSLVDVNVQVYHGDLDPASRAASQDAFMEGSTRVMVATNAFGMGVDKADIRAVIHRNIPGHLDALAQEIGRGGRDGGPCRCLTYLDPQSVSTQEFFISCNNPDEYQIGAVFNTIVSRANPDGFLRMTQSDIANQARVPAGMISSIMQVLMGAGLIERQKSHEKIASVRFEGDSADPKFETLRETILGLGGTRKHQNGFVQFDLLELVAALDRQENTVSTWLRDLANRRLITYNKPFVGSSTQVLSRNLSAIDFARLKKRAQMAHKKLQQVIKYCNLPDRDKHEFLEEYFNVSNIQGDETD